MRCRPCSATAAEHKRMTFSEETLSAYADGEVDAATRAALEAALATDPQLAQRVAHHRALRARVRDAFTPVLEEPVPERLLATVRGAGPGQRTGNVVALRKQPRARWTWPQWGAMAASLVVGVMIGPLSLQPAAPQAPLERPATGRAGRDRCQLPRQERRLLPHVRIVRVAVARGPCVPRRLGVAGGGARSERGAGSRQRRLPSGELRPAACRGAHAR